MTELLCLDCYKIFNPLQGHLCENVWGLPGVSNRNIPYQAVTNHLQITIQNSAPNAIQQAYIQASKNPDSSYTNTKFSTFTSFPNQLIKCNDQLAHSSQDNTIGRMTEGNEISEESISVPIFQEENNRTSNASIMGKATDSKMALGEMNSQLSKYEYLMQSKLGSTVDYSRTEKNILYSNIHIHKVDKPYKKTFSDQQQFTCNICRKEFINKTKLERHMLIHNGIKLYKCDICGKSFSQKSHLQNHVVFHMGEKPHQCEFCGKKFSRRSGLRAHALTHSGEKPHQCDFCGKNFSLKRNLKDHIRIHTGEKPYQCEFCEKKFSTKAHLKTHTKVHKPK